MNRPASAAPQRSCVIWRGVHILGNPKKILQPSEPEQAIHPSALRRMWVNYLVRHCTRVPYLTFGGIFNSVH